MKQFTCPWPIEQISDSATTSLSYCPTRGGLITSLELQGQELLYLDETTFLDSSKHVRGGIPILFPNAGAIESLRYPNLKQHGFARTCNTWISEHQAAHFTETLRATQETRLVYPFEFELMVGGTLNSDGSVDLFQEVRNLEQEKPLPLAMGLHPYFFVRDADKSQIRFLFPGGEQIEQEREIWLNGGTAYIRNPKLQDPAAVLTIAFPQRGKMIVDVSPIYEWLWVWSLPGKDFLCIEPMMRSLGGFVNDPYLLSPQDRLRGEVKISRA